VIVSRKGPKEEIMRVPRSLVVPIIALVVFSSTVGFAQDTPAAPQPSAEHKVLEEWVGSWAGSGEMKPGPFGPGGTMTWTEDCSWFGEGKFHVVCKSEGSGPMGPSIGLGILGYHPDKKVYTHYGVDSTGWAGLSEGTRSGDSWKFTNKDTMGGKTYHGRFEITMVSAKEMRFSWEMSEDGKNWIEMMAGTSKKK